MTASELCVGVRGNARHPRRAASHFAEGLFCPPAGGVPALLDGRNPLEYLSTPMEGRRHSRTRLLFGLSWCALLKDLNAYPY